MTIETIKNKDMAVILYDLYNTSFNRLNVSMVVTEKQQKKYECCNVTKEEIWVHENGLTYLADSLRISVIDSSREWAIGKRTFLLQIFKPAYKIVIDNCEEKIVYNTELDDFILKNNLGQGVFANESEMKKWLITDHENVSAKDAYKLVENVRAFMQTK